MTPGTIIVGIGQPMAGDDGVGCAVARRLNALGVAAREAAGGAGLLPLLFGARRVLLVDAAVGLGRPPGTVVVLAPGELPPPRRGASSHGFGLSEAVALARALGPIDVRVVAVAIDPPPPDAGEGLSPAVAAAVTEAAARVRELAAQ